MIIEGERRMRYNTSIQINKHIIDIASPTYFVADIAANHNGDLEMAKELIYLAKEAGANAVKFQHFFADKIVSDYGFKNLDTQSSHQAKWNKSVYETYKDAEFNRDWNRILAEEAEKAEIDYFTTPYDYEAIDQIDKYVPAYKIGSGDITWIEFIEYIAKRRKPVLLATGASNMWEVEQATEAIIKYNRDVVVMQCNTNYTSNAENYRYINLNVLKTYAIRYPEMILGLSDHTFGYATVLGAIALGARVIEKHFTANNCQVGPDHAFSMNPSSWKEMVERARELEYALGNGIKKVEGNEQETVVLQRRCVRAKENLQSGIILSEENIELLRPAPKDSVFPYKKKDLIGKKLRCSKEKGEQIVLGDVEC
jgi:N-acetylneuraminate synthase